MFVHVHRVAPAEASPGSVQENCFGAELLPSKSPSSVLAKAPFSSGGLLAQVTGWSWLGGLPGTAGLERQLGAASPSSLHT